MVQKILSLKMGFIENNLASNVIIFIVEAEINKNKQFLSVLLRLEVLINYCFDTIIVVSSFFLI